MLTKIKPKLEGRWHISHKRYKEMLAKERQKFAGELKVELWRKYPKRPFVVTLAEEAELDKICKIIKEYSHKEQIRREK